MTKIVSLLFLVLTLIFISTVFSQKTQAVDLPPQAVNHIPVCPPGDQQTPRCHAQVVVNKNGKPQTTTYPAAYGPDQFLGAYNLNPFSSSTRTIAVVDAYDHPNIFSDLNYYSQSFGIPQMASCLITSGTTTTPCFQKVDQRGGTSYPSTNSGWALEIALDVEIAHAICQNCNILLVEADSNSYSNLMAAVDQAVAMGADVVSNSYGSGEFYSETSFDSHFNIPGVAITFSSGDSGYGASYPAASPYVTAVGGTTLTLSGNTYVSEKAWRGAGSGCSALESKPGWQVDTGCSRRMIADVSADADPNTGAAVYDSVPYNNQVGWFKVGGTSLASPLIAATFALAGNTSESINPSSLPYSSPANFHDVTSGSNGRCRNKPAYFCNALSGYDGPTGLGTPNGFSAF